MWFMWHKLCKDKCNRMMIIPLTATKSSYSTWCRNIVYCQVDTRSVWILKGFFFQDNDSKRKWPTQNTKTHKLIYTTCCFFLLGVISHWLWIWAVSQSHDTVEHTIKLKSSSPRVSALVLSIDFWRIKQWPTTTKAASSPVENVAYVSKPKLCTGLWYLFHWKFRIHKSKLAKL